LSVRQLDATRCKKSAGAISPRLAIDIAVAIRIDLERPGILPGGLHALPEEIIEHLLSRRRTNLRRPGEHPIEIEEAGRE